MEFLEDLGEALLDLSQQAVKRSRKQAAKASLKARCREQQALLDSYIEDLGKLYYAHYALAPHPELADLVEKANRLSEKLQANRQELERLTLGPRCPRCRSCLEDAVRFCPQCGLFQGLESQEPFPR